MKKGSLHKEIRHSIREIIFGLEDSIVSASGVLTGIAFGTGDARIVILSGLVLIAVEGTSMAAGSYLSSKTASAAKGQHEHPVRAASVMGIFFGIGGVIPLVPYFFLPVLTAPYISIALSALALFGVGYWSAHYTKRSPLKSGFEMLLVSLGAAVIGFIIGSIARAYFGIEV